jgi:chromosome segregation ATPase
MGRERYRRLPRTILYATLALLGLAALLGWSYSVRQNRANYQKVITAYTEQKEGIDKELHRMTRYVEAGREWVKAMAEQARQLDAKGEQSEAAELKREMAETERQIDGYRAKAERYSRSSAEYAKLLRKYQRAASRPWLPISSDPARPHLDQD